ncbi:MAG: T9SS type A sorting domain-containing protein [Bacteroidales bacterium]|nr:T9SS type A sorting domain-containing protein [Bacteroidales bacterium]
MKKIFTIILIAILSFNIKAQTSLTEAVDFTGTDCYGEETINLFEILDRGQYVLIDFYFYSCPPCQTAVSRVVEAYEAFGCNKHDVFFLEVTHVDNDEICQWWAEKYGVGYPTISRDGGGVEIRDAYNVPQFPTLVLIAPDRKILLQDMDYDSIKELGAQYIIDQLAQFGIEQHNCDDPVVSDPVVDVTIDETTYTTITATFTPSEECASYHLMISTEAEMAQWAGAFGVDIESLVVSWGLAKNTAYTHTWKDQVPNTEYTIYVLPKDAEGNALPMEKTKVSTEILGGEGVSVIDLEVEVLSNTSVFVTATPNEETSEYHYILIEKAYADSIGIDSTMQIIYEDPYALYDIDEWEWIDLTAKTEYYAIAQGKNVNGEWGEITKVEFVTSLEDVIEFVENNFKIYPNPATSHINIKSEMTGKGEVGIYDMTGRLVKNVSVSDLSNATINLSDIEKGIYLININGKKEKVVIGN